MSLYQAIWFIQQIQLRYFPHIYSITPRAIRYSAVTQLSIMSPRTYNTRHLMVSLCFFIYFAQAFRHDYPGAVLQSRAETPPQAMTPPTAPSSSDHQFSPGSDLLRGMANYGDGSSQGSSGQSPTRLFHLEPLDVLTTDNKEYLVWGKTISPSWPADTPIEELPSRLDDLAHQYWLQTNGTQSVHSAARTGVWPTSLLIACL